MIGLPARGLSEGTVPSGFSRSTFPARLARFWAKPGLSLSPMTTYSLPSGPNMIRPPLRSSVVGKLRRTVKPLPSARIRRSWFFAVPDTVRVANAHTRPSLG